MNTKLSGPRQWNNLDTKSVLLWAATSGAGAAAAWLGIPVSEEFRQSWLAIVIALPTVITGGRAIFRFFDDNRTK